MTDDASNHHLAAGIFADALDIAVGDRRKWIHRRCGSNTELRGRVERLLEDHDRADATGFLDEPAIPLPRKDVT